MSCKNPTTLYLVRLFAVLFVLFSNRVCFALQYEPPPFSCSFTGHLKHGSSISRCKARGQFPSFSKAPMTAPWVNCGVGNPRHVTPETMLFRTVFRFCSLPHQSAQNGSVRQGTVGNDISHLLHIPEQLKSYLGRARMWMKACWRN